MPSCNLWKSDRIQAPNPDTGEDVALFNPRVDDWDEHFQWDGDRLVALTATGRATIRALDLNHSRKLRIRRAEKQFGLFPP